MQTPPTFPFKTPEEVYACHAYTYIAWLLVLAYDGAGPLAGMRPEHRELLARML